MKRKGIDVSKHQGNIDWNKVKADGIEFAIIRIGYGGSEPVKDSKFEENYKNARAVGIKVGAYLYSYANSQSDIDKEKASVKTWLNGRVLDLPFYIDVEDKKTQGDLSVSALSNLVNSFCEFIENLGYWAGIYANKNWLETKLDMNKLNKYTVWVAQWTTNPTYQGSYAMWQYTSNGSVDGISGRVDMNYQLKELGGSLSKEVTSSESETTSNYKGNSIVDYLKSIGVDSSFANRKKLAKEYGISNYTGTAEQNTKLLNLMRDKKITSNYKGNSIVDYLKSIGVDSSFDNRKKLASSYGISNYTGTAEQNTKLLNMMRG